MKAEESNKEVGSTERCTTFLAGLKAVRSNGRRVMIEKTEINDEGPELSWGKNRTWCCWCTAYDPTRRVRHSLACMQFLFGSRLTAGHLTSLALGLGDAIPASGIRLINRETPRHAGMAP